jgi:tripartite-type tricarboxylate transporter receptor subunit TctC
MKASADGRTIGLLNAPGLILAAMSTEAGGPHVLDNFTILGRVARTRQIWATGSRSGLRSMDDLLRAAAQRPIIVAISDVGSTGFANAAIGASLLGIDLEFVAGYAGSGQACLAAVRGESDVIVNNFETTMALIEAGDLRPLLQVGDTPVAAHPSLIHVPLLGGRDGAAVRRARELGSDTEQARKNAAALAAVVGAGRVLVGPRGMDDELSRRLERALHRTLTNPEFVAAAARANWSLDVADGMAARAALEVAMSRTQGFLGTLRAAIERVRR